MTDKEIIKALGSERYMAYGVHGCVRCKYRYHKGEDRCGVQGCKIARGALELIDRQQAEIEKLKEEKPVFYCERVEMSEAEIETYNNRPIKLVVTKHSDKAELLTAENELLKEKIKRLEKELENNKAVATKFEEECKSLDEKIEKLNLSKEFFELEYDSQFKANKNLLAEVDRLKAEIKKHKSKTAQEFVIRLLKKSLDAIPLADIYTTLEEMEGDEV